MKTVRLGKSELIVTKPAMGCLPIQRCSMDESKVLLRKAFEGGIRYFDTANAYTDSERKIGNALSDVRDQIIISTKSTAQDKNGVLSHIENSLRSMKTDYIDLFQFHNVKKRIDVNDKEGAYAGALIAKERGWIRHIGITSHRADLLEEAIDSGDYETVQFPFSYISTERDLALAERAKKADVGFIAMKGLAGGHLAANPRACHAFMNAYENVVPIWGIQKVEELEQWLQLAEEDPVLDEKLFNIIQSDRERLAGSFCRGCGYCTPCSVGIQIYDCARMDMYLRRARWQDYLQDEWREKMHQIENCIDCGLCKSRCPYQLDTPNLLKYMLKDYNSFYESHKHLL